MEIQHFHIVGINYKKTDVAMRGQFALSELQYKALLDKASLLGLKNVFVLSTCNRTEIYGVTSSEADLAHLLCSETIGSYEIFEQISYSKNSKEAVKHLFSVAAGLDSQILGDYEIVGQLKQSIKFSKQNGNIDSFAERLTNTVFEASKAIKNKTLFSGGTISVAFAAIQFLRLHSFNTASKKILLIGTGKIGKNTCKNLTYYLGANDITLINRSNEKAEELARELGLKYAQFSNCQKLASEADIIIVATNAPEPILSKKDISNTDKKIFIDLSVPNNINVDIKTRSNTILVNVDDLSKLNDETLQMRKNEIPKVREIITHHMLEFFDWYKMHLNGPIIRAAKQTLLDIHLCPWFQTWQQNGCLETEEVQKEAAIKNAVKSLAVKMRQQQHTPGCSYIETLNEYIAHRSPKQN